MFFAADRAFQERKRRKSHELSGEIKLDEDNMIVIGKVRQPKNSPKSIDAIYPDFSSKDIDDIVKVISEPDENIKPPPNKKSRTNGITASNHNSSAHPLNPSPSPKPRMDSWDDLIKLYPHLMGVFQQQQEKLNKQTVSDEYIREVPKTKPLPALPIIGQADTKPSQSIFQTSSSSGQPAPAPTGLGLPTAVPAPSSGGGGLLSGIDDLFGSSSGPKKKSTLKRR